MAIETQNFEARNELADMMKFKWELKWLIWNIAENADKKQINTFVKNTMKKDVINNADACFLCTLLDKSNLNLLSPANRILASTIVNNGRWEWIEEMYNNWKRKEIDDLFGNIENLA